jgi:hypothetical protein
VGREMRKEDKPGGAVEVVMQGGDGVRMVKADMVEGLGNVIYAGFDGGQIYVVIVTPVLVECVTLWRTPSSCLRKYKPNDNRHLSWLLAKVVDMLLEPPGRQGINVDRDWRSFGPQARAIGFVEWPNALCLISPSDCICYRSLTERWQETAL